MDWRIKKIRLLPQVAAVCLLLFAAVLFLSKSEVHAANKVSEGNEFVAADGNTYTYTLYDDDTAILTSCNVANKTVVIPGEVDGHAVVSVGIDNSTDRFIPDNISQIDSITVNVPAISDKQFVHNDGTGISIGEVTIGEDVKSLGYSLFSRATIGEFHFNATDAGHDGIFSVVASSGGAYNTTIGHLTIGANVTRIPKYMFEYATIEQDELELHAATIENYAFKSRQIHIGTLTLTDDVKYLGYYLTSYSTIDTLRYNITQANYASSLNSIFGSQYESDTTTTIGKLEIGSNVRTIPDMAFEYVALDQEELTLDMDYVGNEAFKGANVRVGTLNIGENMARFGYSVFAKATIGTINYNAKSAAGSSTYSVFGSTYSGDARTTVTTVNIGDGVTDIPQNCFRYTDMGTLNYN